MNFKKFNGTSWEAVQHKIYGSGTDSLTAFPAVIQASGDPLTDYTISGNTIQNGTPTPEAPVDAVGCGERSVNMMPSSIAQTIIENGVTMTCDGLGRYEVSGTAGTGGSVITLTLTSEFTIPVSVGKGGQGCMLLWNNIAVMASIATLYFMYKGSVVESWSLSTQNRQHNAYTSMGGQKCDAIRVAISGGKSVSFTFSPEFVETGSYPQEYEPYGYKIPFTINGTEHPIYLGQAPTTRKIKKLVLTGEETVIQSVVTNCVQIDVADTILVATIYSSHFQYVITIPGEAARNGKVFHAGGAGAGSICFGTSSTPSNFKQWLSAQYSAGNPVTVWYVLAEPETAVVNEPMHKIGNYADTITMEQAGVTIPTSDGDNIISFGTTVHPSGMSATFRGWHPVQAAKQYDGNDWS